MSINCYAASRLSRIPELERPQECGMPQSTTVNHPSHFSPRRTQLQ